MGAGIMQRSRYKKSIIAVIEGVRAGETYPSIFGVYGRQNLVHFPDAFLYDLVEPPAGFDTGIDPVMGSTTISAVTATFVAIPELVETLMAAQKCSTWGSSFVWEVPAPSGPVSGVPGRWATPIPSNRVPPAEQFHSSTTTYEFEARGTQRSVISSLPLPPAGTLLACYEGSPQIGGRRLLIMEWEHPGEARILWRGFIESVALSSQQTEIEITAVDPLRVLGGVVDDPIRAAVTGDRDKASFIWSAGIDLRASQILPAGETPLPIVVKSGDKYLPTGADTYEDVPATIHTRSAFTAPGDEDEIDDPRAEIVHGHDPDGILGEPVGEHGLKSPDLVLRWIDHHLRQPRITGDGITIYDGAPWKDIIEESDFDSLSDKAPFIDHALLDATVSIDDLERWCLAPLGYFLRITDAGRIGASRIRSLTPGDFQDIFSTTPGRPSQRAVLLPDRIDMDFDLRRGEATYVGELGGVVDGVEPDEIFVRPGRAPTDPAPRYMGSERRFDFRLYQRGETGAGLVTDRLRDSYDISRRSPIINAVVPLTSFSPWGVPQRDAVSTGEGILPAVGEWIRLDGGPETGVICADGKRRRLKDLDVEPIGILISKSVDWRSQTAEIRVLMVHWDGAFPRLVAPAASIRAFSGTTRLLVGEEYDDADGQLGFLIGDQVRLADRSGRYISPTIYTVISLKETAPREITVSPSLTAGDQEKITSYAQGGSPYARGVVLRLAEIDEYENSWGQSVSQYFLDSDLSKRLWAYWGADPADLWTLS